MVIGGIIIGAILLIIGVIFFVFPMIGLFFMSILIMFMPNNDAAILLSNKDLSDLSKRKMIGIRFAFLILIITGIWLIVISC